MPVFALAYFGQHSDVKISAAIVYAVASFTDFLDGYIARKYKLISNLGRILDPLGDKLMTMTVLLCITIDGVIPVWAVAVALSKELLMLLGGAIVRHKEGGEVPSSNMFGKTSTVVFFLVCVTLMLFRSIPENIAVIMISTAIALMIAALVSYSITFLRIMRKPKDSVQEN